MEQEDPMSFTKLTVTNYRCFTEQNKKPRLEPGRVTELFWNPESQISTPDCRRDTYASTS